MADTDSKTYKESDSHVPNPTDVYGTVDTSGTAGAAHGKIEAVTPIFEIAKQEAHQFAKRAVDPSDTEVSDEFVILPDNDRTRDEALEIIRNKAEKTDYYTDGRADEFQVAAAQEQSGGGADAQHAEEIGSVS